MSWARSAARCASLLPAVFAVLAAAPAGAGTFSVRADALSFPAYDETAPGGSRATALVTVTCERDCPAQVTIRLGEGMQDESPARRRMANTARQGTLSYELTLEAEGGAAGETLRAPVQEGVPLRFRISGRIPSGQTPHVGSYRDRVTVLVDW